MYSITENKDFIKLDVEENISYYDLSKAIKEMLDVTNKDAYRYNLEEKFSVKFREKAMIYNRNKDRIVKKVKLNFFDHERGMCYRINKRSGYLLSHMDWNKISSIEIFTRSSKENKENLEEKKTRFFKRVKNQLFDETTWSNLNENSFNNSNGYFYYLNKIKLYEGDKQMLEEAFKEKKTVHINQYSDKRHYSIETKMSDDGVFRAWFSSEYIDCANGSYYLLLNPNVAVHYEND